MMLRRYGWTACLLAVGMAAWPVAAWAQSGPPAAELAAGETALPAAWYLVTAALALLVPAGIVLVGAAGLPPRQAWDAALGALGAMGLAGLAYWAVGFALEFGGAGLVYPHLGLRELVWEWSPLTTNWGMGWGVAGLTGWFLAGGNITALAYALFLSHLPAAMAAALIPVVALRGRAPATATLALALFIGGLVYPLAANWVYGGGWLGGLGNNVMLGHGFVDFAGAGTVFLVAAMAALAALVVWVPRRPRMDAANLPLPPAELPLLAVVGAFLLLAGSLGWMWSNPLQLGGIGDVGMLRGSANAMLFAIGGVLVPLLYTWFVTGQSDPLMSARGLAAGVVAGLAVGPFVQLGAAFAIGLVAGATVPFITYLLNDRLRLDDATGTVSVGGLPAVIGLLCVGLAADGVAGRNWNMTGLDTYLGVAGQGVSGLLTASGYQIDFPGQLQAQVIGILALGLWGLVMGMLICAPLGLLLHSLTKGRSADWEGVQVEPSPVDARRPRPITADAGEPRSPAPLPDRPS